MTEIQNFILWFLQEFPTFLMTPPISAFTGMYFLLVTVAIFRKMTRI